MVAFWPTSPGWRGDGAASFAFFHCPSNSRDQQPPPLPLRAIQDSHWVRGGRVSEPLLLGAQSATFVMRDGIDGKVEQDWIAYLLGPSPPPLQSTCLLTYGPMDVLGPPQQFAAR